jgi:O-antigen/teichoic acid export membrane protein
MLTKIAHSGLEKTDLIMIGILLGAVSSAEYAVAAKLATVIPIGNTLLAPLFGPRIKYQFERSGREKFRDEYLMACHFATLLSVVVFLPYLVFGPTILGFFGDFESSYQILLVLGLAYLTRTAFGSSGRTLYLIGFSSYTLVSNILVLACVVISNYILINLMGIIGAALGTHACFLIQNIADQCLLKRHLGRFFLSPFSFLAIIFFSAVVFIIFLLDGIPSIY